MKMAKSFILLLLMSLITIHCNSQSNCNVGEVAKYFIESIIKRDFDTYIKYNGSFRIELAQLLERTPEFDRGHKKEEFRESKGNFLCKLCKCLLEYV